MCPRCGSTRYRRIDKWTDEGITYEHRQYLDCPETYVVTS